MSTTSQNLKLGIFVSIGLAIAIAFIYFIGSNQNMFGSTITLSTKFRNIAGLQPGANVRFSGINVGTVDNILIVSDTSVKIELQVDRKASKFMKRDSRVLIGSDGIMGDKVVNITAGHSGTESVHNGDKLRSEEPLEMDAIFAKAEQMATGLNTITANVADMTSTLRQGKGTIGMLLYDQRMADRMRGLMYGLNRSATGLAANMDNLKEGTSAFSENMKAVQGNILLRGYFKKKEKEKKKIEEEKEEQAKKLEEARQDSIQKADKAAKKAAKKQAKAMRKEERRLAREAKKHKDEQMATKEEE